MLVRPREVVLQFPRALFFYFSSQVFVLGCSSYWEIIWLGQFLLLIFVRWPWGSLCHFSDYKGNTLLISSSYVLPVSRFFP